MRSKCCGGWRARAIANSRILPERWSNAANSSPTRSRSAWSCAANRHDYIRWPHPGLRDLDEFRAGYAEIKPLHKIDLHFPQCLQNRFVLDELRDGLDADIPAQLYEVAHQRTIDMRAQYVLDERTVDLDEIEGQLTQVVKGVIADAEIVERE